MAVAVVSLLRVRLVSAASLAPRLQHRTMARLVGNNKQVKPYLQEVNRRRAVVELDHRLNKGTPVNPVRRSEFKEWNYEAELGAWQHRLGEVWEAGLLVRALVTPGWARQQETDTQERAGVEVAVEDQSMLVREGREVVRGALVAWIRGAWPRLPEEMVQDLLQYLTSHNTLAEVGFYIGLRELVKSIEYPPSKEHLADSLEAVVGALARTEPARAVRLATDLLCSQLAGKDVQELCPSLGLPGRVLANICANSGLEPPQARLVWQTGPASLLACHTVALYSGDSLLGSSPGETLETAEEMAARDALRTMFDTGEASKARDWGGPGRGDSDTPNPALATYTLQAADLHH